MLLSCSLFDSNYGADAAAINLAFYNVRFFHNVTFRNNTGSAVRVSISVTNPVNVLSMHTDAHRLL